MGLNSEHINPFVIASQNILATVCNEEIAIGKLSIKNKPYYAEDVVVIIGVTGELEGQVIFNLSEETARAIVSKMMMGAPVPVLDEMAKSGICELANMMLGNTATNFYNNGIKVDITPPSLLFGQGIQVSTLKGEFMSIPLQLKSTGLTFEISVCIGEKK